MTRTITNFLFCFPLLISWSNAISQSTIWRPYEPGSNYQPVTINKMTQDPFGRMWLGTSKGLFSFDGSDFTNRTFHDSTSQNITAVFCDSTYVYAGFDDGKLVHRSLKNWEKEFMVDDNLHAPIVKIIADHAGRIWIATYGKGLFIKKGNRVINITVDQGLPGNDIYTMAAASDGMVWLGTDGGLTKCKLEDGNVVLKTYSVKEGLCDEIVRSLVIDGYGIIWIGTQDHGVCTFDPVKNQFAVSSFSYNWSRGPVSALAIQNKSRLMVGTLGKGVICVSLHDNFHPIYYDQSTGYDNLKVSDITEDSEGNFWVVSPSRGLDQFPALFAWVTLPDERIKSSYQAVLYDSRFNLWFATLDGLFKTYIDSSGNNLTLPVKLKLGGKEPVITSLYEDFHHHLWIGTFDDGIFFNPAGDHHFIQIRQVDGLANDNVLSVSGDKKNVWIATLGGVTRCDIQKDIKGKSDLVFNNFTEESGLHSSYLYQTFIDSKGRVWFATDGNGLKVFENGSFKTYEKADTFDINTVYSITEDFSGNIWFSTPSSGIFKFDGKVFVHYGLESGISDLSISGIATDANGDIVILENDAIDVLEIKTNQVRRYRGKPTFEDISPNLNAFCRDQFGNIWIATKKGILKYYSPSTNFSHQAQLEIRQVMVYLEPLDIRQAQRLTHRQNHLTFDFQAFWNSNPSQLRYRYMLEGHDLDWIKTKDERAIYPQLRPGTYTFKIQATIHHNFDDAPTQIYTFTIDPPFWTTWWFITGMAIAGGILINFLIKERDRRREREEKLKRERIEFQFENLKSQLNPHFLFNSFNTLAALVEEDQKVALSYIDHLSDFYRSLLSYKDIDLITLEKELELTNNYIFLLKERYGDRLTVITTVAERDKQRKIPPLTLQLLIENAVKHNVVSKDNPLKVEIFTLGGEKICVKNLLQKKSEVKSIGFGLQNIRARCELLGSSDFQTTQSEEYFQVCVPLFNTLHAS